MSGPRHRGQIVPDTWVTPFPFPGEAWMPWKECSVMDERLRFVARLLDGEAMSEVCRAFGISRKTGYKIFERRKVSIKGRKAMMLNLRAAVIAGLSKRKLIFQVPMVRIHSAPAKSLSHRCPPWPPGAKARRSPGV